MANKTTINNYAALLGEDLEGQGYAIYIEEIQSEVVRVVYDYLTWHGSLEYANDDIIITGKSLLSTDEISLINNLVRAKCDVIHANREVGAGNLGITPTGVDVSTANSNVDSISAILKIEASFEHPYSVNAVSD